MVAPKLRILQRTRQGDNVYFLILSYLFLCIQSISYEIQLGLIGLKFQCLQKDIWTTSSICTVKFNRPQMIKLNWPYITNMQQNSTNTATNFQVAIVYAVSVIGLFPAFLLIFVFLMHLLTVIKSYKR